MLLQKFKLIKFFYSNLMLVKIYKVQIIESRNILQTNLNGFAVEGFLFMAINAD